MIKFDPPESPHNQASSEIGPIIRKIHRERKCKNLKIRVTFWKINQIEKIIIDNSYLGIAPGKSGVK